VLLNQPKPRISQILQIQRFTHGFSHAPGLRPVQDEMQPEIHRGIVPGIHRGAIPGKATDVVLTQHEM
jgi:hypothetical protein